MAKIKASDILAHFRKTPRSDIVIERLNVIEKRKRDEEDAKMKMQSSISGTLYKGAELERKHKIAKIGGLEEGFFKSLFKPELTQSYYELGLEKVKADPSLLGDNWLKTLGQGLSKLFNPKVDEQLEGE